jgi:putative transposase
LPAADVLRCLQHQPITSLGYDIQPERSLSDLPELERTEEIMRDACADFGTGLAAFNGEPGHLQLLVSFPPKRPGPAWPAAASRACRRAGRGKSSLELARHYWRANGLWSGSSFAGSAGGAPISVLRQYIEQQNQPA